MASRLSEESENTSISNVDSDEIALDDFDTSPLSASDGSRILDGSATKPTTQAHLTFVNCLALIISLQIGSGIFSAPSQVSAHVSSPLVALSAWFLGGAIVYSGAMVFVELGTRLPQNGGMQDYLREAYGDFSGWAFSWTWLAIAKPSSMAIISTIFSDYFCRSLLPQAWLSLPVRKAVALLAIASVTSVNCLGVRSGALVANGFLCLKLFALFSIALTGFIYVLKSGSSNFFQDSESTSGDNIINPENTSWEVLGNYAIALYGVLYCYGGWENAGFVAGEMKNPIRDLPRALKNAMIIVIVGFALFNIALYSVVPFRAIEGTKTPVVEFGTRIMDNVGGVLCSLIVATSALGSLNSNVYSIGRLYVSAANRGYLPRGFSDDSTTSKSHFYNVNRASSPSFLPLRMRNGITAVLRVVMIGSGHKALNRAMIFNACLTSVYILGGTFDSLITFVGLAEYSILLLVVAGTLLIRRKSLQEAAYAAHTAYIVVFCTTSGLLVLQGVIASPLQGVVIGSLVAVSWILHRMILT